MEVGRVEAAKAVGGSAEAAAGLGAEAWVDLAAAGWVEAAQGAGGSTEAAAG